MSVDEFLPGSGRHNIPGEKVFSRTDLTSMVGSGAAVWRRQKVHKMEDCRVQFGVKMEFEDVGQVWSQGKNDPRQGEMGMTRLKGSGRDGEKRAEVWLSVFRAGRPRCCRRKWDVLIDPTCDQLSGSQGKRSGTWTWIATETEFNNNNN